MAEQKDQEKEINFCKIESTVTMNEDTYEITEKETMVNVSRNCSISEITFKCENKSENIVKAYRYQDDEQDKISVYATKNTGEKNSPIYEDFWYIKLTVKKEKEAENQYIYINFVRHINDKLVIEINQKIKNDDKEGETYDNSEYKIGDILEIIKEIAKHYKIYKIVLQDDAEFPCHNELIYGIKALQLRALQIENLEDWNLKGKGKLSIYQSYGYIPTKYTNTEITGCIRALQQITCKTLNEASLNLKKLFTRINEKDIRYDIYRMLIKEDGYNLKIEYSGVKQINYSSICQQYIKNLDELIDLLKGSDGNKKIGEFYKEFCQETEETDNKGQRKREETDTCCASRGKLLGCLKNSVNSYVIVIKGILFSKNEKPTCCDANIEVKEDTSIQTQKLQRSSSQPLIRPLTELLPQRASSDGATQPTSKKDAIIVTKLFNLFNGTFEKLKYIFHHMELHLDQPAEAAAP